MRALVIEPNSGISGDMFVAAAARLAACEQEITELPAKLGLPQVTCGFRDVARNSIQSRKFDVAENGELAEEVAHATLEPQRHHAKDRHEDETHRRPWTGNMAVHQHRSLSAIRTMILAAGLDPAVTDRALRMFQTLGTIEATVHGIPVERIHFHEVGAIDSIIDVVASALCIERLNIGAAYATPVCVGSGTVERAHGTLPVPAPATERLLQGMPTTVGTLSGEWTTPTGALILKNLEVCFELPVLVTRASAYGAGARNALQRPNVVRLRLCETGEDAAEGLQRDELVAIRCNIDDASGEHLGADLVDSLLEAGARDVVIQSVIMKKGRPGQVVEVLVDPHRAEELAAFLLANTSSIGVRLNRVTRFMLPRETCIISTAYGPIAAKAVRLPDGRRRIKPEYEACRAKAQEYGVSLQDVYRAAMRGDNG
jgi:pyridinium-3,5-bisthiocarboxylic acid mononucleotide nickel chelatase